MIKENLCSYIFNAIKENWDNSAFTDYGNGSMSYADTGNQILRLHKLFQKQDIEKGDKIVVIGKNSGNWCSVYLAAVSYGAVIVPLLQDFTNKEIYNLTNHSDAKLLFASGFICDRLDFNNFDTLQAVYCLENMQAHPAISNKIEFADEVIVKSKEEFEFLIVDNSNLAAILYTSGTSGSPKGVMLQHNSLAANVRYARANMPLESGDSIVSFLPLAHCYGAAFEFLFPFSLGCSITFLGKLPSPQIIVKAFQEIRPKLILSVPLVIEKVYKNKIMPGIVKPLPRLLLKIPIFKKIVHKKVLNALKDSFGGNFKEVVIGGAKMNEEVEIFLRKIGFQFSIGYGMTECGPLITYDGWKTTKLFSAGKAVDTLEIKINNPNKNGIGEIFIRGEHVMLGYYKNDDETKKAIDNEKWLHTGDLGFIDEDNYLFIKGRSKSMILGASGQNIYPEEIESRFNNFPLVAECLVVSRNEILTIMIYPDQEKIQKLNLTKEQIAKIFANYQKRVNEDLPQYMKVKKLELREEEFIKTPKKNIKRVLYE